MPRPRRTDKVRFLRTPYYDGELMQIPEKYKFSNMIDSDSLPECIIPARPVPKPDPDVYNFPSSYWPSPDTPLIPADMSATELWEECAKNMSSRINRTNGRIDNRKRENKSNSSVSTSRSSKDELQCIAITNDDIRAAVLEIESLPQNEQEQRLNEMKSTLSEEDHAVLVAIIQDKRKEYFRAFRKSYMERGVGPMPKSDNPAFLARELSRRIACQNSGLDWKKNRWPVNRRKQHLPARHEVNVPRK